jgi:hypothetical protein
VGQALNIVAVRTDESTADIAAVTMPVIEGYAREWNAALVLLTLPAQVHPVYRIAEIANHLRVGRRVLSLDVDVAIMPFCPNPFDMVPPEQVGSVREDVGNREDDRWRWMQVIQAKYGDIGWNSRWVNTGFMVLSPGHEKLLAPVGPGGWYYDGPGLDDAHIGWQIARAGTPIRWLPAEFNSMKVHWEPPLSMDRTKAHVIHYAGCGAEKAAMAKEDLRRAYG